GGAARPRGRAARRSRSPEARTGGGCRACLRLSQGARGGRGRAPRLDRALRASGRGRRVTAGTTRAGTARAAPEPSLPSPSFGDRLARAQALTSDAGLSAVLVAVGPDLRYRSEEHTSELQSRVDL